MSRNRLMDLVPSIILALGMLASSGVAVITSASGWLVMAGPLVMALAMAGAGLVDYRLSGAYPGTLRVALILGAAILLAGAIVAGRDPGRVATLLPILGSSASIPLIMSAARWTRERRAGCLSRRAERSQQA